MSTSIKHRELTPHDARELNLFRRYLICKEKYGMDAILRRTFWQKYLGLEPGKYIWVGDGPRLVP